MDAPQQDLRLKIRLNDQFSDNEKNQLLELLNARKKYGLVWEDKPEAVEQQMQQQLPVFVEQPDLYIEAKPEIIAEIPQLALDLTDADTQNPKLKTQNPPPHHLLIEGDNLHALTALAFAMPEKVDVIYIDPPYNTGNKDFIYNDSFVDREDGYRHSKWLSFMAKRLQIAKKLLKNTGVIFISIDDNEQAQLKMLCDEVFGEENFMANVIWQSRKSVSNDTFISLAHNSTLISAKNLSLQNKTDFRLPIKAEKFENPDNDERGLWVADPFDAPNLRPNLTYPIINPNTNESFLPPKGRCWRTTEKEYLKFLEDKRIVFGKNGTSKPQLKRFLVEVESKGSVTTTIWNDIETTTNGTQLLEQILGDKLFNNPKPVGLINRILQLTTNKDTPSVILDFFAGSGTTLHAVMQLNAEDGGNRQCILVTNNENNIAREVCYERNKRVIAGYVKPNGGVVKGLANNHLHYFKVDFAERSSSLRAKLDLVRKATDLLRLKENCWDSLNPPQEDFAADVKSPLGEFRGLAVYKNATHYLLIVYDDRYLSDAVDLVATLAPLSERVLKEYVLTYVFSHSPYNHQDEFEDVLDKVRLCALPEAIYNALRDLLP